MRSLLLLTFVCALGCSGSVFGKTPPPEVRNLLVGIATRHIGFIVLGDVRTVAASVYSDEYFGKDGSRVSPAEFVRQVAALKAHFPATPESHPLLGLRVTGISQHGNHATVSLEKDPVFVQKGASNTRVDVTLNWSGSAWMVSEDSLFGADGQVRRWLDKKSSH